MLALELMDAPPITVHELHRHRHIVMGMSSLRSSSAPSAPSSFPFAAKYSLMPISFFDIENNHVLSGSLFLERERERESRTEARLELSLNLSSRDNLLSFACSAPPPPAPSRGYLTQSVIVT